MPQLDLGQMTQKIQVATKNQDVGRWTAAALRMVENAINMLAKNTGASPVGNVSPPPAVQQLQVKSSGELAHVVIQDNNPIAKNVHYFVEYATEPNFLQPQVEHLGTSRTRVVALPTNTDGTTDPITGITTPGTPQQYYFRAYSQYPGSKPSRYVNFGGNLAQPVSLTGSTNLTLLPSTGSGTAQNSGQQGGYGFGHFLHRGAPQPKRSVRT